MFRTALTVLMIPLMLLGCDDPGESAVETQSSSHMVGKGDCVDCAPDAEDGGDLCVGLRGNGARIHSHFGALARIHEHYGLISGIAGGSSGGISAFLTESIYANPLVFQCGDAPCTEEEAAERVAFLYKTLVTAVEVVGQTRSAVAVQNLAGALNTAVSEGMGSFIFGGELFKAIGALTQMFTSSNFRSLLDGSFLQMIKSSPDKMYHLQEFLAVVQGFGSFQVEGQKILVRPGLVRFDSVAEKVGRLGSFYAMYGPADNAAWSELMNGCSANSRGLLWPQISHRVTPDGSTCRSLFAEMIGSYFDTVDAAPEAFASRAKDQIGAYLPALVTTSVVTGQSGAEIAWAQSQYALGEEVEMALDYDDVRFGYWGDPADLAAIAANPQGYQDEKTKRFMPLGAATYERALSYSPAEPGLASVRPLSGEIYSVGGWPDHVPAPALKNMGCDRVILVTRQGAERGFRVELSRALGMTDAQEMALYDLGGDSAVTRSLEAADGVWCTDFDSYGPDRMTEIMSDGYNAPLESASAALTDAKGAYPNTWENLNLPSCTPGVQAP